MGMGSWVCDHGYGIMGMGSCWRILGIMRKHELELEGPSVAQLSHSFCPSDTYTATVHCTVLCTIPYCTLLWDAWSVSMSVAADQVSSSHNIFKMMLLMLTPLPLGLWMTILTYQLDVMT